MSLEDVVSAAPLNSQAGLHWFAANMGQTVSWTPILADGTRLFSTPKGIYKPKNSVHALSVRQTLNSPYHDREPLYRADGTWSYSYFQEGNLIGGDLLFTNQGLKRCIQDGVPVGVARQTSAKPGPTVYAILGVARVTEWRNGFFQLEGYSSEGKAFSAPVDGPLTDEIVATESRYAPDTFEPASQIDARERVLGEIVRRRGQKAFRSKMLRIYGGKCAICECAVEAILEAAHITPYLGTETNRPENGLLLRADLHTLWDLGLLAIDTTNMTVWVSPSLSGSEYELFNGRSPLSPKDIADRPSKKALDAHWQFATALKQ